MPEEYNGKFLFISNVRTQDGLVPSTFAYDTEREAEIKYHHEVEYGLQNANIILAHYMVVNEYGVRSAYLEKIIDNQPAPEPETEPTNEETEPTNEND